MKVFYNKYMLKFRKEIVILKYDVWVIDFSLIDYDFLLIILCFDDLNIFLGYCRLKYLDG